MRRGWHARGLLPILPQLHRCPWPCLQKWWVFSSNFWWYLHIASWQSPHVDDKMLTTISWHDTSVDQVCNIADERDVYIAERLFSSSLVAVVSGASPRTLRIEHFKKVSHSVGILAYFLWWILPGDRDMPLLLWRPNPGSPDEQSCKSFYTPRIMIMTLVICRVTASITPLVSTRESALLTLKTKHLCFRVYLVKS